MPCSETRRADCVDRQIAFLNCTPLIQQHLIAYGPRRHGPATSIEQKSSSSPSRVEIVLRKLATLTVPHAYFLHFYVASVTSSIFWASQLLLNGSIMRKTCERSRGNGDSSMSIQQVAVTWAMVSAQGVRRLLETWWFQKSSTSSMWFVHWLMGIAFYLCVGISVWIEGAGTIKSLSRALHQMLTCNRLHPRSGLSTLPPPDLWPITQNPP